MYPIVSWLVSCLVNTSSNQGFKESYLWHIREPGAYCQVEQPGTARWVFLQKYGSCEIAPNEKQQNSDSIYLYIQVDFGLLVLFMKSHLILWSFMNSQSLKAALNSEKSEKQGRNIYRNGYYWRTCTKRCWWGLIKSISLWHLKLNIQGPLVHLWFVLVLY